MFKERFRGRERIVGLPLIIGEPPEAVNRSHPALLVLRLTAKFKNPEIH